MTHARQPRTRRTTLALAALLAMGGAPLPAAHAAACTFNPASGNWNVAANWSCALVPSGPAADSASIGTGKTVTVNDPRSIFIFNNAGALNLDASTFSLQGGGNTTNSGTLNVGGTSTAALQMLHAVANSGGVINIANGSVLNQFAGALSGGTVNIASGGTYGQQGGALNGATINGTGSGVLAVNSSAGNVLNSVTLGARMDMAGSANSRQRVTGGLALNGASIDLNNNGILSFEGTQALTGSGTIVLGSTGGGNRIDLDGNGTTTFGAGVVVRGHSGSIGQEINIGGTQTLLNLGTISADVAGGTITLLQSDVSNQGTLSALNGGTLVLASNVTGSGSGQIVAGAGSRVIQNGVTLAGQINTSGSGLFQVVSSAANRLSNAIFNGSMDMASNASSRQRVSAGGLELNGSIHLDSNGILSFEGNGGLNGNASVVFGSTGAGNRIDLDGDGTTTFASGVVVRGHSGTIGQQINIGGTQTLVNNGLISADTAGGTIGITESTVINNGTLQALNGGTLVLSSNVTGGASGQIVAGAGSQVVQSGVTLSGRINTSGSGLFSVVSSSANRLDAVTLNGQLDMASIASSRQRVSGGLTLDNGRIDLNNNGSLSFEGTQALTGSGTIVLGSTGGGNRIDLDGNGTTTFGTGVVVRGHSGSIGQEINTGGTQTLLNLGTISADVAGGTITLLQSDVSNQGTLSALNGGTLVLASNVTGSGSGQIVAGAGSRVIQNGVTLAGQINTSGSGLFQVVSSVANRLSSAVFNGSMDMASNASSRQRVSAGGLELNGSIHLDGNGILSFEGNGGLGGNASVVFGSTGTGNRIDLDGDGTTTFASGVVVRGHSGSIGQEINIGGTQTLVNHGLISADTAGGTIRILGSDVVNNHRLQATNGGVLELGSAVTQGATGTVLADNGTVLQNGVRITGGTLASANGGALRVTSSFGNVLDATTVTGTLDMATLGSSRQRVNNGLVNNGRIDLNNNGILSFEGTQTLSGSGSIVFGSTGAGNRIDLDGDGTTTFAAGTSIRGHSGTIGQQINVGGTQVLVNHGTINADGAGGSIGFADSALVNHGLLRAQAGTLNVGVPLSGTGTLQVDASGRMNLADGTKSQGTLAMGGTGAALNLGSGNLVIGSDYTNAGAGSGNSFNRRAGISGSGQVVAGGNAAQLITGSGVSGGNTPNATLTIGNVRVGSTTFDVQIGNSGTTGPTLRGALQTAANGGNISDPRLSGSAVTASNYTAGGPGQNSGNLGVTFTATSAGALAPLSGQVVNLRSNFENIADQKLNIVLGSGAAAYNAAVGSATSPVTVANQRVNGTATAPLTLRNTAAAGAFSEDLNASVVSVNGPVVASGAVNGLLAGAVDNGGITVGVATGSAGFKTGTVNLAYQTAGAVAGVSNGLGAAGAGTQAVTVNGNVYQPAAGQLVGKVLNFGTLQVGQQVSQNLVVRNTASGPAGFVEDLNVSFGASGNAQISGSGSLSGVRAGSTSAQTGSGSMTVTVSGQTVGALNSGISVNYTSAGTVAGTPNGLGLLGVGSEVFGVNGSIEAQGNVINPASPLLSATQLNLGAARVGDPALAATLGISNQLTTAPQAALNASIASNGAPFTAGGSVTLLAPGASSNALQLGLGTALAGSHNGSATVQLVSDASNVGGCGSNCQMALPSQTVALSGKVYTPAAGAVQTPVLDFGIVRVGDTVSARQITIANTAATTALNDTLRAGVTGLGGALAAGAPATGIAAQGLGQVAVTLNTHSAGVLNQTAQVQLSSQNPDMADLALGSQGVTVTAQVNNLANADFDLLQGLGQLSDLGNGSYLLDLGTLALGSQGHWALQLDNEVGGPADLLRGSFDLGAADDFALGTWADAQALAAGDAQGGYLIDFDASQAGRFEDLVVFRGFSFNASDPDGLAQERRLLIRAHVLDPNSVPEPATLALVLLAALAAARRRPLPRSQP